MKNRNSHISRLALLLIVAAAFCSMAQQRTVGVMINDTASTWKGYTLLAPKLYTSTYLINNEGRMVNKWVKSTYPPGQSVYLLPNGNLLRACQRQGSLSSGGGEGGRIEEYTWNDSLVWSFDYSTTTYMSHHDIRPLPNGNVLLLAVEKKTVAELLAAGFDQSKFQPDILTKGYMLPDYVVEVRPTRPVGGTVVWEWHTWNHLIQDFDATKQNYGVVADHPELVDCDGDGKQLPLFWNHMNSVTYNAKYDQVMMSVRGNSEIWVIDHTTTTAEAAGHTGGRYGKGGDLLYRYGNPACYKAGTTATQKFYQQHDAEWVDTAYPGAGNITIFNNGIARNYSTADEITPPIDNFGNYTRTAGQPFGPVNLTWSFSATPPASMYATAISGAQRLGNGNTLICDGTHGTLLEVTPAKQVVWKYISPVTNTGPVVQGDSIRDDPTHPGEKLNMVFRAQRYSPNHPGLSGRTLVPGNFIELTPVGTDEAAATPSGFTLQQNYPNPFNPETKITFTLPVAVYANVSVYNALGQLVAVLHNGMADAGVKTLMWDASAEPTGVYVYELWTPAKRMQRKMLLMK